MFKEYSIYKMVYKSKILNYRLTIGKQNFDIDADLFKKMYTDINDNLIEEKELKIVNNLLLLENIFKKDVLDNVLDISDDEIFLEYIKNTIDMSKYTGGTKVISTKDTSIVNHFVYDDVKGSQLNLLGGMDLDSSDNIGSVTAISRERLTEEDILRELELYGIRLDKSYKVGGMDNVLDEPCLEGFGISTKLKYRPVYLKHRRFFSNVVFLVDHVKTTTGGVKAKKIAFTLLNDDRFTKTTNEFLKDIDVEINYGRIRNWYKIATGKDMLECKGKLIEK